jgi:predicted Zn-dependent peptidase
MQSGKTMDITSEKGIDKIIFDNGLTLLIDQQPHFHSIAMGFFLNRGSRDESVDEKGYYHFAEHMLFKGTATLKKDQIAKLFDGMGGYINAYTTHENVVLYNRVPDIFFKESLKIMGEMWTSSSFSAEETAPEIDVVLNEINSTLEDPSEKLHEDFQANLFKDQPLGDPITGNPDSIRSITREKMGRFYINNFTAKETIISIAGNVKTDEVIELAGSLNFSLNVPESKQDCQQNQSGNFFTVLPSEQVHIIAGTAGISLDQKDYIQTTLLNLIFGETMSSRLFQRIREELGLCYSISSFIQRFRTENIFGFYSSIMPKNSERFIAEVSSLIANLIKNGITEEELDQAKKQKTGELILQSDHLQKKMQKNTFMEFRYHKQYDMNDIIAIINSTTRDDINHLIKTIFQQSQFLTQTLYRKKTEIPPWKF